MNQCSPLPGGQPVKKFTIEKVKIIRGEHFKGGAGVPVPGFWFFASACGPGRPCGRQGPGHGRDSGVGAWAGMPWGEGAGRRVPGRQGQGTEIKERNHLNPCSRGPAPDPPRGLACLFSWWAPLGARKPLQGSDRAQ